MVRSGGDGSNIHGISLEIPWQVSGRKLRDDQERGFAPLEIEGWDEDRARGYVRTLEAQRSAKEGRTQASARTWQLSLAALDDVERRALVDAGSWPFPPRNNARRNRAPLAAEGDLRMRRVVSREKHKRQTRLPGEVTEAHARVAAVVVSFRAGGEQLIPAGQLIRALASGAHSDGTLATRRQQERCLSVLPVDDPDRKLTAAWRCIARAFKSSAASMLDLGALEIPRGYQGGWSDPQEPGRFMQAVIRGRSILLAEVVPTDRWRGPRREDGLFVEDLAGAAFRAAEWPPWYRETAPAEWPLLAALSDYAQADGSLRAR